MQITLLVWYGIVNNRAIVSNNLNYGQYSVSQKNPPCGLRFSDIFSQTVENFKSIFTHLRSYLR